METIFLICAVTGGTVLVLQFLAGIAGFGSDHDVSDGHDAAGDHDSDHSGGMSWFAGLITFRTVTAGLTFFGLAGMTARQQGAEGITAWSLALFGGALALYLVAQIMLGLKKLKADGAVRIERTVGEEARVYLAIPARNQGPGKVTVTVQKRTMEFPAYSDAPAILPTGSKVRIVAVRDESSVTVEPLESVSGIPN